MKGLGQMGLAAGTVGAGFAAKNPFAVAGGIMSGINTARRLASDVKFVARGEPSAKRQKTGTGGQRVHGERLGGAENQPKMSADAVSRLSKL